MPLIKKCSNCKVEKPRSEFPFQNKSANKIMSACKICSYERVKVARLKNIDKVRLLDKVRYQKTKERRVEYAREYRRKHPDRTRATNWKGKYGITPEYFYNKLNEQNNKCDICNRDMNDYGKIFCVDHNHKTGKVRGLLCDPCNYGLGFYEKHKEKYVEYLIKHTW